MKNASKIYVNYIIKKSLVFYLFIFVGIAVFLGLTMSTKVNVINTYNCKFQNGYIVINSSKTLNVKNAFVYKNKDEKIYNVAIDKVVLKNSNLYLKVFSKYSHVFKNIPKKFYADIIIDKQSLLKKIFIKVGRNE